MALEPTQFPKFTRLCSRLLTNIPPQVKLQGRSLTGPLPKLLRGVSPLVSGPEQQGTTDLVPRWTVVWNVGTRHPRRELGAVQTPYRFVVQRGLKLPLWVLLLGKRPIATEIFLGAMLPSLFRTLGTRRLKTLLTSLGLLLKALKACR